MLDQACLRQRREQRQRDDLDGEFLLRLEARGGTFNQRQHAAVGDQRDIRGVAAAPQRREEMRGDVIAVGCQLDVICRILLLAVEQLVLEEDDRIGPAQRRVRATALPTSCRWLAKTTVSPGTEVSKCSGLWLCVGP